MNGISKECSTKRQWDVTRWNQKEEKAIGTKEDAKELNFFLDSFRTKINSLRTELLYNDKLITAVDLIGFVNGKYNRHNSVLEEFLEHNEEIAALVKTGEYSDGTRERYEIIAKYSNDPNYIKRGSVLPGRSNQRMNEYLKKIAVLCEITETPNTHKARRT